MSFENLKRKIIDPNFLILAYSNGYFPMAESKTGPIHWYSPDPRGIIPLESFHIPDSLQRTWNRGKFEVRSNTEFEVVIRACADRPDSWISEEIVQSYLELHRRKYAYSVETWMDNELAGGLYGVAVGGAFFGESMFHRETDASKIALIGLVHRLRERGFILLDTQYITPHLNRFGAIEISAATYKKILDKAVQKEVGFM